MDDQQITLTQGATLTAAFRAANPSAVLAEVSGSAILNRILAQPGCTGIRIYKGLDTSGNPANVLVGIDVDNNDMVNGVLGNRSIRNVGSANALNS